MTSSSPGSPRKPLDAVVIGAGITGLTAAYRLRRRGFEVMVLEASERGGGVIETVRADGFQWDLGPNTVLDGEPEVRALLADVGLTDRVLSPQPAARRRYLWLDGRLVAVPSSPLSALRSPILSFRAKLRLLREPFVPRLDGSSGLESDESVASFVRRRLGSEVLTRIVEPMVSGIHAGDPERLSLAWAFPKLAALEREHGSLVRGAFARRTGARRGGLFSFPEGMSELPLALAQAVGPVRWGTPALALARGGNRGAGYSIATPSGEIHARSVIVATDAQTAATLLDTATAGESQALAEIPHAPVAVVGLGFRRSAVAHPLDGFGFLVPRGLGGGLRILGCVFGSTIFEGRAPKDAAALTIFLGGRTDPELVAKSEREIVDVAEREVASVLGITEPALARVVRKWERGIPQFERGHARFVAAAERIESNLPGLALAGNWRWGVSVPNAIQAGERAAARIGDHAAA